MTRARSASVAAAAALAIAGTSSSANAEPTCARDRVEGADTALAAGLADYRAALGKTIDEDKLREAIASFERACALGEPNALQWRAFAFIALSDHARAAASLVSFARAASERRLGDDDRARIRDAVDAINQTSVTPKVTILRVVTSVPASVRVDGADYGSAPSMAIVQADRVVVEASATGFESARREVDTTAGGEAQTSFDLSPALKLEPVMRAQNVERREGDASSPWPLRLGIAAGITGATTIAFTVWRENRVSAYDDMPCPSNRAAATGECASLLSAFETARTLQVTSLVVTLALAGTALTWWLLDREPPPLARSALLKTLASGGLTF